MVEKQKILITSALPYVNNVPHLGNLIGCVLSADIFARFKRLQGNEVLYICGADEHGTATETKAKEANVTPKELCDKFYSIHKDIYKWFNISFDHFGRTSEENHVKITQDLFKAVEKNGYVKEQIVKQPFCEKCNTFLADRFVRGTCPHCNYEDAGGDQCDECGKLLNPEELINPRCKVDGTTPIFKETNHLFLNLDKLQPILEKWVDKQSVVGNWTQNTIRTTQAWFKEGLKSRAISRDLKWGINIPRKGFEDKVFYVWFDAPIGYISITEQLTKDWKSWWKNPKNVKLFQFMGKDNIPFHSIIFPATLLAANTEQAFDKILDNLDNTLVHHIDSTEYLNYENGKFSKSRGTGVFGDNVQQSGIPSDVYRYYLLYNRPEKSDSQFTWKGLQERLNNELVANFGNFVNRTISFTNRFLDNKVSDLTENDLTQSSKDFVEKYKEAVANYIKLLNEVKLREALQEFMKISALGNQFFQESAPWKSRNEDMDKCKEDLFILANIVHDLAILIEPYMPEIAKNIFTQLKVTEEFSLDNVAKFKLTNHIIGTASVLFKKVEDKEIDALKAKYTGNQNGDAKPTVKEKPVAKKITLSDVDLRVGRITEISQHPDAEKLFVEKVDIGDKTVQIVSGLVPYYSADELLGKNVVIVTNLEKADLRGVLSEGMLLAAETKDKTVGVITAPANKPGDKVSLETDNETKTLKSIDFKQFSKIKMKVKEGSVFYKDQEVLANGKKLIIDRVLNGKVS